MNGEGGKCKKTDGRSQKELINNTGKANILRLTTGERKARKGKRKGNDEKILLKTLLNPS